MKRYSGFIHVGKFLLLFAACTFMAAGQTGPGMGSITWQKYPAPEGGIIHCIYAQNGLVLAGTTEGVYRSDDTGRHWRLTTLNRQRVHCFLRLRDGRLLAGTERGISASKDNGLQWAQLTDRTECTALYETADGTLFAGRAMGSKDTVAFYTSTDMGANWAEGATLHVYQATRVSRIFEKDSALYLVNSPRSWWAGSPDANMHISHDHGRTWYALFSRLDYPNPMTAIGTASGTLLVGGAWKGVKRSTDNGSSWSAIEAGFDGGTPGTVRSLLELDPGIVLAGCQDGAYLSTDDGLSWTRTTLSKRLVKGIADNAAGTVLAATAAGIHVSTDRGVSWEERNTGLSAGWFGDLVQTADGAVSMVRCEEEGRATLFRTQEFMGAWDSLFIPDAQFGSFHENDQGDFFTVPNSVWFSTDKGGQWHSAQNPSRVWMSPGDWLSYGDSTIIWGGNRSTDKGRTWAGNFPMYSTTHIAECTDGTLYSFDDHSLPTCLVRSRDRAATWEKMVDKIRSSVRVLSPCDLVEASAGTLLLATRIGVYRWHPGDSTFVEAGLTGLYCTDMIRLPGGTVVVGTEKDGTFLTTDDGESWVQCNEGLTQLRIWQLLLHRDGYLLAATEAGMFRTRCGFDVRSDLTVEAPTRDIAIVAEGNRAIVPLRWISRSAGLQTLRLTVSYEPADLSLRSVTGLTIRSIDIAAASGDETDVTMDAEAARNDTSRILLHFDVVRKPERNPVICRISIRPRPDPSSPATISLCDTETVRLLIDGACNPLARPSDRLQLAAYPNPAMDAVHIRYRLPESRRVNLRILDNSGREVHHRADMFQHAGSHEYVADASALPVGTYRIVLIAGEHASFTSFVKVR